MSNLQNFNIIFLSLNIVLILANSADPGEMPHYATYRQGLHFMNRFIF